MKLSLKIILFLVLFFVSDFLMAGILKNGMERYYGLNKNSKILCIGHSHTVLGIDTNRMEKELNVSVSKYAISGANILDRSYMIKHFLKLNPGLNTVIYDVDARLFDTQGLSSASYTLFLPFMDNAFMDQYLKAESTWQEYILCKAFKTARFRDQTLNISIRGLIGKTETIKNSQVNLDDYGRYLKRESERRIRINVESVKKFEETIHFLNDKNIRVYLAYIPVIDKLNEIDRKTQEKAINVFKRMSDKYNNVSFLNYNKSYEHNYELFFDLRHLNEKGKQTITGRVINDLKSDNQKLSMKY